MSRRAATASGAGVTVVLAALSGVLINELHHGWPWWLAAGGVVLVGAVLSSWLAWRTTGGQTGDRLAAGAVKAGRDIVGGVTTHVHGIATPSEAATGAEGDQLGPGAVKAGRNIQGDVKTTTGIDRQQSSR